MVALPRKMLHIQAWACYIATCMVIMMVMMVVMVMGATTVTATTAMAMMPNCYFIHYIYIGVTDLGGKWG